MNLRWKWKKRNRIGRQSRCWKKEERKQSDVRHPSDIRPSRRTRLISAIKRMSGIWLLPFSSIAIVSQFYSFFSHFHLADWIFTSDWHCLESIQLEKLLIVKSMQLTPISPSCPSWPSPPLFSCQRWLLRVPGCRNHLHSKRLSTSKTSSTTSSGLKS